MKLPKTIKFGFKTHALLQSKKAVFLKSGYLITKIDFTSLRAFVNKVDTYEYPNGMHRHIEHHFGRWIDFPKEFVKYSPRLKKGITDDWGVGDREEYEFTVKEKYINTQSANRIVLAYLGYPITDDELNRIKWFYDNSLTPNELSAIERLEHV